MLGHTFGRTRHIYIYIYIYIYMYVDFPRSTNKIQFFNEILISEKNYINLMKCLRYEHQAIFHCGGGSNLILGIATVKFFPKLSEK